VATDIDVQRAERLANDAILLRRVYYDIAGDLASGVILSQIIYWFTPAKDGRPRLQVQRDGRYWLAKKASDWWKECRVKEHTARRCIKKLQKLGILELEIHKFGRTPQYFIFLNRDVLNRMVTEKLVLEEAEELRLGQIGQVYEVAKLDKTYTETTLSKTNNDKVAIKNRKHVSTDSPSQESASPPIATTTSTIKPVKDNDCPQQWLLDNMPLQLKSTKSKNDKALRNAYVALTESTSVIRLFDESFQAVKYFLGLYEDTFGVPHGEFDVKTWRAAFSRIIDDGNWRGVDLEDKLEMIDGYFNAKFDKKSVDYRFFHFASPEILYNRTLELLI
jgi:hypothetical protein